MAYVAVNPRKLKGVSVGSGQCVAFVQDAAKAGWTGKWRRGVLVRGAVLPVGTAIATFNQSGRYENDTHGRSHAAIYLGQTSLGIMVLDQWVARKRMPDGFLAPVPHPVTERVIYYKNSPKP